MSVCDYKHRLQTDIFLSTIGSLILRTDFVALRIGNHRLQIEWLQDGLDFFHCVLA